MNKNLAKFLSMGKEMYFSSKAILRGRVIDLQVRDLPHVQQLIRKFNVQGWAHLFLDTSQEIHENEVVKFYMNLTVLVRNIVTSMVRGVELVFDHVRLGKF